MASDIHRKQRIYGILFILCLLFSSALFAQFPEGFEGGTIPSTWTVYNVDGDTKQFTAVNNGANSYEGTWTADVRWNASGNDDWLVTPQINVTSNQKVVRFWARSTSTIYFEDFNIKLSTTGNAVANFTVNVASYTSIPNEWTEYIVDLSSYVGQSVYLAVQCVSYNRLTFRVDGFDWVVGDDMAAVSVTGPSAPTANTATNYIVTVKNNGGNAQNNYSIKLYVDDEVYETQTGTTIASGATAQHTFSWTPAAAQNYILKGEVILANDANPANDTTPDYTVIAQPAGTAVVTVGDPNTTTTSYQYPINFYYKSSISQTIYMEDELNIGGNITILKYHAVLAGSISGLKPLKVWMATTTATAFASTSDWLPLSEFTLVFDGNIDFSGLSGEVELSIPLTTPFTYTGDNLCVMVNRPHDSQYYSSSEKFKNTATPYYPNRNLCAFSDTIEYDPNALPAGIFASAVHNTTFMFTTSGLATLTGTVSSTGSPLANATVSIEGTTKTTQTNAQGVYQIPYLTPGTVNLTATHYGYNDTQIEGVVLTADQTTNQNINMTPMTTITVSGQVVNNVTGAAVEGALITLDGYEYYEVYTDATGAFTFPSVYSGQTYQLKVLKPGYQFYTMDLTVGTTNMTVPDIMVSGSPSIVEALVGDPNTTTTTYSYPVNFFYKSSISQAIYMADELSSEYYLGAGTPITQISYNMNLGGNIPANKPLKVWMANTTESSFATTSTWIPQSEFTLVWDGTVDLSTSGPHELTFELDEPYPYEGNNLVIMIQRPLDDAYYSTTNTFKTTTTAQYPNRTIYRQSDTVDQNLSITTVGTLTNTVPNTSFTFVTTGFATLTGVTTSNGAPLAGVKVAIDGTNNFAMSDEQGNYTINYVIAGENSITASKFGYYNNTVQLNMPADEVTTHNFNLTQLPNVTITGVIHGSDTGAGLSNATVSLTGYENYQTTTNANGEFTIPGVYTNQTYTIETVKTGYQNYVGEVIIDETNTNLGTLVMSEIAYPVTNVFAEISGDTVILSWNAPQIPNDSPDNIRREGSLSATGLSKASSHKIIISKDAFSENTIILDKDNNTNFKEKTYNTRTLIGYAIWRTPLAGIDNQGFWTSIQNDYEGLSYTDQSWEICPSGEYKYIVSAVYTDNVLAEPTFSNTIAKDMMATVTINLSTSDGQSAAGADISLINVNNAPEQSYETTATDNVVVIPNVWLGVYNLTITKNGYMPYTQNNLVINQIEYTHPTVINLQVGHIFFAEGFEGDTFPPDGWILVDADEDGHNWELAGGVQIPAHDGDQCTASASYDNSLGALTPDNYIISPIISLTNDALAYNLSYWVAPQDTAYFSENYSLMISTAGTNIAVFSTLISETLTNTSWEQRTLPLNEYIGQNIYIAFRHHNSTDNFMIKIDDIEIERALVNDEEVIIPVIAQTALKGNYPNPFNPETSIAFDLANDGNVCIDIFNIKGQKVKALVNDRFSSGTHSVVWNGKDDNGKNVGSGIYFYNMKSGKYTSTRKMILMK